MGGGAQRRMYRSGSRGRVAGRRTATPEQTPCPSQAAFGEVNPEALTSASPIRAAGGFYGARVLRARDRTILSRRALLAWAGERGQWRIVGTGKRMGDRATMRRRSWMCSTRRRLAGSVRTEGVTFRSVRRGLLTDRPLRRQSLRPNCRPDVCCHSFQASDITKIWPTGEHSERATAIPNHASTDKRPARRRDYSRCTSASGLTCPRICLWFAVQAYASKKADEVLSFRQR